ncbi:class I SAM-dependent methyltransferase [Nocardioides terrisoli]|uniref:class I SAM-dependent methyltransferase n=1 Tax=Nocardioides terrisoli TaxID=3388267 RepID=UPI00287B8CDE|nr:methyltransferase domain-containing protein [Nocardioides marmorisolisilvae]
MTHSFDEDYWDQRWPGDRTGAPMAMAEGPPNPHLVREVDNLEPGTALDTGCGAGVEAIWLASRGWQVTGADIAGQALGRAAERPSAPPRAASPIGCAGSRQTCPGGGPGATYDLVTTHYAHPAMPQLEFYDRVASWVAPGGTLLIVGHLHHNHDGGHGNRPDGADPPASASVTAAGVTARLDLTVWKVVTARESHRTLAGAHSGGAATLHDVVLRATRRH